MEMRRWVAWFELARLRRNGWRTDEGAASAPRRTPVAGAARAVLPLVAALVLLAVAGLPAAADVAAAPLFQNPSADLDHCENGPLSAPVQCTGSAWGNGNLNQNSAH